MASWVIVPVLDAVRPAPEHLAVAEVREVVRLRLGQRDDVGVRDDLLSRDACRADERGELRRRGCRSARRSRARA